MGQITLKKTKMLYICSFYRPPDFNLYPIIQPVLGSLLLKSNLLHITLYFEATLCIIVTYYCEIKVTSNILY